MTGSSKNTAEPIIKNRSSMKDVGPKRLINKKPSVSRGKPSNNKINGLVKPASRPRNENGASTTLKRQNIDQTYITQENSLSSENDREEKTKPEIIAKVNRDKNGTANRLPPGVRLYQQAKNSKARDRGKKKDDAPSKPVLTKNVEEMLISSNREKCEEVIKNSNVIHETLTEAGIDKTSMIEALFSDPLFKHVLGSMLFNAKILGKNKLETFLHNRIITFVKEYETDKQIKANLSSIHQKIKDRIERLKNIRKKYHDDFDQK